MRNYLSWVQTQVRLSPRAMLLGLTETEDGTCLGLEAG